MPDSPQVVNASAAAAEGLKLRREQDAFIWAAAIHNEEQPAPPREPRSVTPSTPVTVAAAPSSLPPEWICQRESHCTYGINTGNGYFGKWQFALDWGGHFGLPADITTWTPAQEDFAAAALWANGAGCSNWNAC